jgi:hypothetical protein
MMDPSDRLASTAAGAGRHPFACEPAGPAKFPVMAIWGSYSVGLSRTWVEKDGPHELLGQILGFRAQIRNGVLRKPPSWSH